MAKIPMIFTGSREIEVERIGKVSPVQGQPFVKVFVPLDMADNLSRDKYWAWAKAEPPGQTAPSTQPPENPEEKKEPPKDEKIDKVDDKEKGNKKEGKKK